MKIITEKISLQKLLSLVKDRYDDMIKAVVDVKREIMAVGAELHSDEEAELLNIGSEQHDLWGINIYFDKPRVEWIEFDSMINIRPSDNNRSRGVEDELIKDRIIQIVNSLIV